jgi:hypothetical protein
VASIGVRVLFGIAVTALEQDRNRALLTVFGSSKKDDQVYVLPAKILCYI